MRDVAGYWAVFYKDPEDDTIVAEFPDHPTVMTYGTDREDAIEMAREALNAALESDYDRRVPLLAASAKPKVKRGREAVFVPLDPEVRTAFLLRGWREEKGLSQAQMARKMDISTQAYQRMERPGRSNLTVATLDRIAVALGKHLVLALE